MTFFSVGAAIAAGVGMVGTLSAAHNKKNAAEYNKELAQRNAKIALDQSEVNESAQRRRAAVALGKQVTATSDGPGLSGTALDLYEQSAAEAELDALNIRYAGKLGVLTHQSRGELYGMEADNAETAGVLNAAAAGLSAYGGYTRGKG